jgi:hypothetical protein
LTFPTPAPPRSKSTTNGGDLAAKTARIDLDADEAPVEGDWELRKNYADSDDTSMDWTIRAKEEDLDKVAAVLDEAVEKAKAMSHMGLLTGLPRSAFPRIIGSKQVHSYPLMIGVQLFLDYEQRRVRILMSEKKMMLSRLPVTRLRFCKLKTRLRRLYRGQRGIRKKRTRKDLMQFSVSCCIIEIFLSDAELIDYSFNPSHLIDETSFLSKLLHYLIETPLWLKQHCHHNF